MARPGGSRQAAARKRTGTKDAPPRTRPSVPLDLPAHNPRLRPGELDPASRLLWLGLGALILALVVIAVHFSPKPTAPRVTPDLTPTIDGIVCGPGDVVHYQTAVHLDMFVRGKRIAVPSGVGQYTTSAGACHYALHTTDATGVIRVQAASKGKFTLGQFFAIWGMPLSPTVMAGFQATSTSPAGAVRSYVDGRLVRGDPRSIALAPHSEITLEYGPPWVTPSSGYAFPKGT